MCTPRTLSYVTYIHTDDVVQDTYGTYAELRHKAQQLLADGHEKSADIEAQRNYMDTVCRSYAARLEKRRNLLITSVRYHRLAEEVMWPHLCNMCQIMSYWVLLLNGLLSIVEIDSDVCV